MCKFLSGLAWKNGDIWCDPEHTDSHEEMILDRGLDDKAELSSVTRNWVRWEFTPGDNIADPSTYTMLIDEQSVPSWCDAEYISSLIAKASERIRRMVVNDRRPILLGGCWILVGDANIVLAKGCRIITMRGNAQIRGVRGNAQISDVRDNAQIRGVWDNAQISGVGGNAQISGVRGNAQISSVRDNAQISDVGDNAQMDDSARSHLVKT